MCLWTSTSTKEINIFEGICSFQQVFGNKYITSKYSVQLLLYLTDNLKNATRMKG